MFDTLHYNLPRERAGQIDLSLLSDSLTRFTEIVREDNSVCYAGYLNKNFKVSLSDRNIKFKGSLAKYFFDDNYNTLTRSDTKRALEKMADELHLNIFDADLTRIDFARNLIMDYSPQTYYPYLGESQYFTRLLQPKSLYYSNSLRQKLFYDKKAEGRSKKVSTPRIWDGQNTLRYELRIIGRIPQQLNCPEVKTSMLFDEDFYMKLFDRWHNEYLSINKFQNLNFNLMNIKSPKDFMKQLQVKAIQEIGQENLMDVIQEMRAKEVFDRPEYYSRLINELKSLCNDPEVSSESDLVEELTKKINNSKKYYR